MSYRKITQLFFLFFIFSTTCYCQSNWKLLYENDSEGNAVEGKLEDLIQAIRDGEEIRIYWNSQSSKEDLTYVEHGAHAKFTTIMNSPNGQFVTAQIDPIMGQTPSFDEAHVLLKENLQWVMIAHSNGKQDTMMRNLKTGEILGHKISQRGTKWFVLE